MQLSAICLFFLALLGKCSSFSRQQILSGEHATPAFRPDAGACDPPRRLSTFFESAEHQILGDALTLYYDHGGQEKGADFAYNFGGANKLSFGQIVTLADFYSNWTYFQQCQTQLSDPDLTWQQRCDSYSTIIKWIEYAAIDPTNMTCIMSVLGTQAIDTGAAADPAQCFSERNAGLSGWDFQFGKCTLGYPNTALCNWDHFGEDAITAYKVGHASALQAALEAKDNYDLKRAYFIEAFAQHFLSDLFSAGHVRSPRRTLHASGFLEQYPADTCNKFMHDEDSATGLWVKNDLGEIWPMYGDKQLLSAKSYKNKDQTNNAMQASANELYQVFKVHKSIDPESFAALKTLPTLALTGDLQNFHPMFTVSTDGQTLLQRSDLLNRGDAAVKSYSLKDLGKTGKNWVPLRDSIQNSGVVRNMYPRTIQDFTPEVNLTQIRPINNSHIIVNRYGPIWTRLYDYFPHQTLQRSWNMISQSIGSTGLDGGTVKWEYVQNISKNTYILMGMQGQNAIHLGLQDSTNGTLKNIYTKSYEQNETCEISSYTIGYFSPSPTDAAILKYCGSEASIVQLWSLSDPSTPPSLIDAWPSCTGTERASFILKPREQAQLYTEAIYSPKDFTTTWTFTNFTAGYASRFTMTFLELQTFPAREYLSDSSSTSATQRVIRVSYAEAKPSIKIDILAVTLEGDLAVQVFRADEYPFDSSACSAVKWFLMDVNDDNLNDVVAYCPTSSTLYVTTFLQRPDGSCDQPYTTSIPADYYLNFNGDYLKHITSFPTVRFNVNTQRPTGGRNNIFQLFDNYGVLGGRLLAPWKDGELQFYDAVGQYPAIAGQLSGGLGADGLGFLID